jgi:hypothetical protein
MVSYVKYDIYITEIYFGIKIFVLHITIYIAQVITSSLIKFIIRELGS